MSNQPQSQIVQSMVKLNHNSTYLFSCSMHSFISGVEQLSKLLVRLSNNWTLELFHIKISSSTDRPITMNKNMLSTSLNKHKLLL